MLARIKAVPVAASITRWDWMIVMVDVDRRKPDNILAYPGVEILRFSGIWRGKSPDLRVRKRI
jgi:hypothetical protein